MKQRKVPLRKCTGCQEMKNKKELIRIVRNDAGEFALDRTGKLPGRRCIYLSQCGMSGEGAEIQGAGALL